MDFTLRQIRYFVAAAESGQISSAARICNVSQSSVTIAIRQLEEQLGFKLFVRESQGVRPTLAGERFLRSSYLILTAVQDASEVMLSDPSTISGKVKIGVSNTISGYFLPRLWHKFRCDYPGIELLVSEGSHSELERGLIDEDYDIVIMLTSNTRPRKSFLYEELLASPRRLWIPSSHPLAQKEQVSLNELEEEEYILLTLDEHEAAMSAVWEAHDFTPKVAFKCRSVEAVRSMVANNMGISIVSDLVYRSWSLEGRPIIQKNLVEDVPPMKAGLVYRSNDNFADSVDAFVGFLRLEVAANGGSNYREVAL